MAFVSKTVSVSSAGPSPSRPAESFADLLRATRTESGRTLLELADQQPLLIVFLRHFGCAYCRQAIHDVSLIQPQLAERGVRPIFVHLGTPERAKPYFDHYHLAEVERVSDPEAQLYRAPGFALPRKHPLSHFLLPVVWWGWIKGAMLKHGIGWIRDDSYQMPGVFVVRNRHVVNTHAYKTIADRPDYLALL